MDDQVNNRTGGPMRFRWFRFSVESILVLMLLVASVCLGWRVLGQHGRLVRQLEVAERARDLALQDWKLAASNRVIGEKETTSNEAMCRSRYFLCQNAVETALQQLTRYEARSTE
jgi:hypothetical protein